MLSAGASGETEYAAASALSTTSKAGCTSSIGLSGRITSSAAGTSGCIASLRGVSARYTHPSAPEEAAPMRHRRRTAARCHRFPHDKTKRCHHRVWLRPAGCCHIPAIVRPRPDSAPVCRRLQPCSCRRSCGNASRFLHGAQPPQTEFPQASHLLQRNCPRRSAAVPLPSKHPHPPSVAKIEAGRSWRSSARVSSMDSIFLSVASFTIPSFSVIPLDQYVFRAMVFWTIVFSISPSLLLLWRIHSTLNEDIFV